MLRSIARAGTVLSPPMPPQQNAASVTAWLRETVAAAANR